MRGLFFLPLLTAFLMLTDDVPLFLWLPCMLLAFLSMFLFLRFAADMPCFSAGYLTMRAVLLAELAASLEWQLHYFLFGVEHAMEGTAFAISVLHMLLVFAGVFAIAGYLEKNYFSGPEFPDFSFREFVGAFLIAAATFSFSNLSFLIQDTPFSTGIERDIFNIRTLVDMGGLAILYAFQGRITELKAERELEAIRNTLAAQYDSYRHYQESIELINFKYHDLKHQLAGLRSMEEAGKRIELIDAMEKELEEFRPAQQTGSYVLDTILAGKMIQCAKNQIKLTCVADGTLLSMLHVTDICSIFGNALDNAIEYAAQLEDPAKRLVHLIVARRRNFLFIEVSNYLEEKVEVREGLPVSTKQDGRMHGYGVKSIRYTVQKYGGTVVFNQDSPHEFAMRIMIPFTE